MSLVSGLRPVFIPLTFPSTASNTSIILGTVYTLDAGVYLVSFSYAIDALTAGQSITSVSYTVVETDPVTLVATNIMELKSGAQPPVDINACGFNTNMVIIPKNNTAIGFSITCNTSAGNWASSTSVAQLGFNKLGFLKIG